MGPFPIESERLLLREFRVEDEAAIHAYAADSEVTRYTNWGPNEPAQTAEVLKGWLTEQALWPRESISLGIELKSEGGRLIGGIGIAPAVGESATGVFGYVLHRAYWRRGFATEASRALLNFSFRVLSLHRVVAKCDTRNPASYRVTEKLGMRREGCFQKDALKHGYWRDTYLYAVLKEEWSSEK